MTDLFEGQLAHQLLAEEDHPGDPEEEDVVTGLEKRARVEELELVGGLGPTEHREREERGREPGVENVLVLT